VTSRRPTLVLALGNDVAGDDAVGLAAARHLRRAAPPAVDIEETGEAGLALLDWMTGYRHVLILDAVITPDLPVGSVLTYRQDDLRPIEHPSPHYAGLPDVARLARLHNVPYPDDVVAVCMAVRRPERLHEGLSPEAEAALPDLVAAARTVLQDWAGSEPE